MNHPDGQSARRPVGATLASLESSCERTTGEARLAAGDAGVAPASPSQTVELFGVPRLLAGTRLAEASGTTLGALAADLARRYPVLAGRVLDVETGWLLPGYSFVAGARFTRDPDLMLDDGTTVLLVVSAAGG